MITNASPLIIFGRLNRLELLNKVFDEVIISQAVFEEVVENGKKVNSPDAYLVEKQIKDGFIIVKKLNQDWNKKAKFLEKIYSQLDKGETETIALALQEKEKEILIDERIARKIAILHGIKPCGSLRVLLLAFKKDLISEKELKEIILNITENEFRVSAEVINEFWRLFEKLK